MDKIDYENQKTEALRSEKEKLFSSRATIRAQADKQKQQILEAFEKMRKRGKLEKSALA